VFKRRVSSDLRASRRSFLAGVATSALLTSDGAASSRRMVLTGVKSLSTTGSIAAGANRLIVASAQGFSVGDSVIVELGGEASGGMPGSPGVGGVWPQLAYPDEAAMAADTGQPTRTYAYLVDTGTVYRWNAPGVGARWFNDPTLYYWNKAVPLALRAQVTGIAGNVLTLSAAAAVASTGARVHFDNAPVFNAAARDLANDTALAWPAGAFACGDVLKVSNRIGVTIAGAGQKRTTLFSPRGVISLGMAVGSCTRTVVCDLTLAGNAYLDRGWGPDLRFAAQSSQPDSNYALDFTSSKSCTARDLTITHPWLGAGAHNSEHCEFRRLLVTTDGLHRYVSWMINWVNSTDCWSYDCEVRSKYLTAGFECFASNHCGHIRPSGLNSVCALNSAGSCVLDSPRLTVTARSQLSALSFSKMNPMININTNIPQNSGMSGNAILNAVLIQKGYINADNDTLKGIAVSGVSFDTVISGGSYAAPDYASPSKLGGPQAIVADDGKSRNTMVSNFRATGVTADIYHPNIHVRFGKVSRCKAPRIGCAAPG
jgi:hypothetical protein